MVSASTPWPAPAKLNLFLHITGRREDGYHLLQSVFQFLDHGDAITIEARSDGVIRRLNALAGVTEEQDLVIRAAQALKAAAGGASLGADIRVEKRLPMGGGLGGGSSDAATVLVALNHLWGLGLSEERLAAIGLQLGADVPVFVRGYAAWAEGVGEHLQPVELPEPWFVVIAPAVEVATAAVFGDPELTRDCPPITIRDFLEGRGTNVCEPLVRRRYPEVDEAMQWLGQYAEPRLTGTGACLFARFDDEVTAREVFSRLPEGWQGFVAQGKNRSPLMLRLEAEQ